MKIVVSKLILVLFISLLLLSGCGTVTQYNVKREVEKNQIFADHLMGLPITVPEVKDLFSLTKEQQQDFIDFVNDIEHRHLSYSERIELYLQNKLRYFNFHSETMNASETMELNSGNCLSLALLTKALTRLTTVGIRYELARTPPVYQRENGLQLASQHIRTVIYDKVTQSTKQFLSSNQQLTIDYYSTIGTRMLRRVPKEEFYAMYFNNKAVESMINNEFTQAYWYIKEALKIKSDYLDAINVLAVIYQKIGEQKLAEDTLLYGLSFGGDQLELLYNYHKLLVATERLQEAEEVSLKIDQYDDPDPFKWLDIADIELRSKNYRLALKYYRQASEKASYLHQPYAGMAKAYYHLGQKHKAIEAMEIAIANSHRKQMTSIYQAKHKLMEELMAN